ncbi:SGNH/GDSL hydrolase family protein [Pseudarthrobacter enclensis]|uniref:Lysophospholipase L1-like esterase n=1 Tax=Pseudarthrobacter enclensis TaxID=993070 RepID=A0ABT9S0U1_9MICC|nr:SGNH/GDSL hydrolase family protein [Pseudarthrobacter enclensis]MDP9890094.1 lysophospholipase L1-like esterase [Pseudarthrobacter enclensis]
MGTRRRQLAAAGLCVLALTAGASVPTHPASTGARPMRVVVIGDSLSTGCGTSPQLAWPALLGADSRFKGNVNIINAAENVSGYLSQGDFQGTFGTQVNSFVTPDTDTVILFGSENDIGYAPDAVRDAATTTIHAAKTTAPNARVIVIGPPSYTPEPEPERLQVRHAIKAAAANAKAQFVDPISESWISGQVDELIGPDGDHPTEAGQHYLLEHMQRLIGDPGAQLAKANEASRT